MDVVSRVAFESSGFCLFEIYVGNTFEDLTLGHVISMVLPTQFLETISH